MKQEIKLDKRNYRKHSDKNKYLINKSLKELGAGRSIVIDSENEIIAGNGVYEQAKKLGLKEKIIETDGTELIVVKRNDLKTSDDKRKRLALADNSTSDTSDFDMELINNDFDKIELEEWGIDLEEIAIENIEESNVKLSDKFGIPPFSVFNAREGWWQNRKRQWISLGIESELGRVSMNLNFSGIKDKKILKDNNWSVQSRDVANKMAGKNEGISIFDPVLCELIYRWFCPVNGLILDCFAGGSVRGIVCSKLYREYVGIDLRQEQIEANRIQAEKICNEIKPIYLHGDSLNINKLCKDVEADLLFSCPPYFNLEVYSDDKKDLSTMDYATFKKTYFEIIKKSCNLLKDNSFACFVVGDVRDQKGNYINFVGDTVEAFLQAGMKYYNEAIYYHSHNCLTLNKQFSSGRKFGKTHQNILIFLKGDAKKAVAKIGECEFGDIEEFKITTN